jgi:hypothetical protein
MEYKHKIIIIDIMMRELEAEIDYDRESDIVKDMIAALKDYIVSYLKHIDKLVYTTILNDYLKNR